ncbi:unnamed protein product [Absidia cylindrospora]
MPPPSKKIKTMIPDDARWCLDHSKHLTFKTFIEKFDCLDKFTSQQRYTTILTKYFNSNHQHYERLKSEYKSWSGSADYQRFWNERAELAIFLRTDAQCTQFIGSRTDQRLQKMCAKAKTDDPITATTAAADTHRMNDEKLATTTTTTTADILEATCDTHCIEEAATAETSNTHHTYEEEGTTTDIPQAAADTDNDDDEETIIPGTSNINDNNNTSFQFGLASCINDTTTHTIDTDNDPWLFGDNNISQLFQYYQSTIHGMISKHGSLPLESYVHEIAALTHILILNKHQHSPTAMKVFSAELLDELAESLSTETMNTSHTVAFNDGHYLKLVKSITDLSMGITTRDQMHLDLSVMAASMDYGRRRILFGLNNMIQKLPITPLKDYNDIPENELWNTYYDPLLSCLVSDPNRRVHLRWTNAVPLEGGSSRPDAIISQKEQLEYGASMGHGEVKVNQDYHHASKYPLCMDTLRLAIFNKNAIDVNKLNGTLAFQIHGFNITFFVSRLIAHGMYVFYEIAHLRFPQSLEDLPSFVTIKNLKLLLGINDVFWRVCKTVSDPSLIAGRYMETLASLENWIDGTKDGTRSCAMRYGQ